MVYAHKTPVRYIILCKAPQRHGKLLLGAVYRLRVQAQTDKNNVATIAFVQPDKRTN